MNGHSVLIPMQDGYIMEWVGYHIVDGMTIFGKGSSKCSDEYILRFLRFWFWRWRGLVWFIFVFGGYSLTLGR